MIRNWQMTYNMLFGTFEIELRVKSIYVFGIFLKVLI
jgi:hypothetical protein